MIDRVVVRDDGVPVGDDGLVHLFDIFEMTTPIFEQDDILMMKMGVRGNVSQWVSILSFLF